MSTEGQNNPERTWLPDAGMRAEKLSVLIQSSPLGIIAVDLDGIIRFWNKAAEKITGWR
jgi:PAS domain-containing protein